MAAIVPEVIWWVAGALGIGAAASTPAGQQAIKDTAAAAGDAIKSLSKTKEKTCEDCPCERTVTISKSASPEAAQHILDAQDKGYPQTLTLDRPGRNARSRANLSGIPTIPDMDRDEYPPAVFAESIGASVRHMPLSDNRSAGWQLQKQMNSPTYAKEGCKVTIKVGP